MHLSDQARLEERSGVRYVEHAHIERHEHGVESTTDAGSAAIPVARLHALLIGPGTTISQAALVLAAQNGCAVHAVRSDGTTVVAFGAPLTSEYPLLGAQAQTASDAARRLASIRWQLHRRFPDACLPDGDNVERLRGMEGRLQRSLYSAVARDHRISWRCRSTSLPWEDLDPPNRLLSTATGVLHSVVHVGVDAIGVSPHLGIFHRTKHRGFVYDIADLYKAKICVAPAFARAREVMEGRELDDAVRACRSDVVEATARSDFWREFTADVRSVIGVP
jgi:CRISPR-associated protein Cas1